MSRLERQINKLEHTIIQDKSTLRQRKKILKQNLSSPGALVAGMSIGFLLGFMVERVKLKERAKFAIAKTTFFISAFYRGMKMVFKILSI